jgi:hypothetical protein
MKQNVKRPGLVTTAGINLILKMKGIVTRTVAEWH